MNEKELQQEQKTLLEEAYEITENIWKNISVYDINRAMMYRYFNQNIETYRWISLEARKVTSHQKIVSDRQVEVIHLIQLVQRIEEENFVECCKFLEREKPNPNNKVIPLYIPNKENENSILLMVQLDREEVLIIREKTFSCEFPTEIDTIGIDFPS
jgi:hypothetical protein